MLRSSPTKFAIRHCGLSLKFLGKGQVGAEKHTYHGNDSVYNDSLWIPDYRLVMICSNEETDKSYIISKLQLFHRQYTASTYTPKFQHYLRSHFKMETETQQQFDDVMAAPVVDYEK